MMNRKEFQEATEIGDTIHFLKNKESVIFKGYEKCKWMKNARAESVCSYCKGIIIYFFPKSSYFK